jgi:hypothetical protein
MRYLTLIVLLVAMAASGQEPRPNPGTDPGIIGNNGQNPPSGSVTLGCKWGRDNCGELPKPSQSKAIVVDQLTAQDCLETTPFYFGACQIYAEMNRQRHEMERRIEADEKRIAELEAWQKANTLVVCADGSGIVWPARQSEPICVLADKVKGWRW